MLLCFYPKGEFIPAPPTPSCMGWNRRHASVEEKGPPGTLELAGPGSADATGGAELARDVLVEPEHVLRIVLPLDLPQSLVVRSEVRRHAVLVVRRGEVDVPAAIRIWREGLVVVPHPPDVRLVLRAVRPHPRDHRRVLRPAVPERGRLRRHVVDGAV